MNTPAENPTNSSFNIEDLPEWARRIVQGEKPSTSLADAAASLAGDISWPALVNAATVSSFLPGDIVAGANLDEQHRRAAERNVMSFAEEVHGPDGTKWALTQEARRSVLRVASQQDIAAALVRTAPQFGDPLSVALREQLSFAPASTETSIDVESRPLSTLEAQRVAATWLTGVTQSKVDLDDLSREITLRRLLRPFKRMVGAEGSDGTQIDQTKVRFFGREAEIARLREYVGVVPAPSILGSVSRFAIRAGQALSGARPLIICGIGGVGKTTLIAKFVLEHAEAARFRYPFTYLDFDRATLSARRPELLLAEMCWQVGAQFAELTPVMRTLYEKATSLSTAFDVTAEKVAPDASALDELQRYLSEGSRDVAAFALLMPLLSTFRKAIDDHISSLESVLEWKRPFLLVLDTFELVQYSDADVRRIEDFIRVLTKSRNGLGWPRLRLIVSGRKRPDKLLDKSPPDNEVISLGVLDRHGCVEMLQALSSDAGTQIGQDDAEQLVDAMIAGLHSTKAGGLHPLSLKLLGSVLASAKDSAGNSVVSQLVQDLKEQPKEDTPLRKALIDGILVRRILEHVMDNRVRALADPGLVVRRITPSVIREVMAKGTPKPGSPKDIMEGDSLKFEPWILATQGARGSDQDEADDIFNAFMREVSLVESDEYGLRHRQDLRQEMLPLIKARRPNRFNLLHSLAYSYFRQQAALHPDDLSSRAEAIYHGLWHEVSIDEIDSIWPSSSGFDPRLDPDEFEHMSIAHQYISAKTRQAMSVDEIKALPRSVAIEWLISRQDTFLEDDYPNEVARIALAAAGDEYSGLDSHIPAAAIVSRLLYRTGQWADSERLIKRHLIDLIDSRRPANSASSFQDPDRVSMLRTWATMSAKSGADRVPLNAALWLADRRGLEPVVRTELLSFAVLGHRLLKDRSDWDQDEHEEVARNVVATARLVRPSLWRRYGRALRFAILASDGDIADLLEIYLDLVSTISHEEEAQPIVIRMLTEAFRGSDQGLFRRLETVKGEAPAMRPADLEQLWLEGRDLIINSLRLRPNLQLWLKQIVMFDHYDWVRPLGNALSRSFGGERGDALRDALVGQKFLANLSNRPLTLDGLSICQWANAGGQLLRLAATIDKFSDEFSSDANDESENYPETAFGIAEALLLWHDTNLASLGGIEEPQPPTEAPPRRRGRSPAPAPRRATKTMRKKA
ncbi:hypothetical protein ACNJYA_09610 [Bradyrhizobium sp. DASA03068]|uniref:hypothetical protein n=1 Tax=Bradyrhizobium sp. BLXBL-01 TaxID=3395915 RepID=UPI003F714EF4